MPKTLLTGATGLVGSALLPALQRRGEVLCVSRRSHAGSDTVVWDPAAEAMDLEPLQGIGAAVHLAGEGIASRRWTKAQKRRIADSRVRGTALLARTLAALQPRPEVLVCASAIGFYGDRGDELLDEDSPPGEGFLPEVCRQWEAAADPARQAGIRVVHLRIGIVLSPAGGALKKMLLPFRLGLGGPLGRGQQFMSWISLPDLVAVILAALQDEDLQGPVNAVAPEPVRNREFARTLGKVLRRPAFLPAPAFALRLLLGREMADALLLASTRVVPARLQQAGHSFSHPRLEPALRAVLSESDRSS